MAIKEVNHKVTKTAIIKTSERQLEKAGPGNPKKGVKYIISNVKNRKHPHTISGNAQSTEQPKKEENSGQHKGEKNQHYA